MRDFDWDNVVRKLLLLVVVTGVLLALPGRVVAPEESFIPPDIGHASMLACWIGGEADHSTAAYVAVGWERLHPDYRAMLAKRPTPFEAIHDCQEWWKDAEKALKEAQKAAKR